MIPYRGLQHRRDLDFAELGTVTHPSESSKPS